MLLFSSALTLHALAVISPGPDFFMSLKVALVHGRRAGLWCSVGFGLGILVHVAYSLAGIALLISQSILLFNVIKIAGALYLIWIGIQSFRAGPIEDTTTENTHHAYTDMSDWQALKTGFLTNALNPKATLFFLMLFTVVITPNTPLWAQGLLGGIMAFNTTLWFSIVTLFLTVPTVRRPFLRFQSFFGKLFGALLVGLGAKVLLENQ